MISIGYMLLGPSNIFNIPDYIGLIIFGMILIGFFVSIGFIQPLPDIMIETQIKFKIIGGSNPELDGILCDTLSAIYDLFIQLGSLLGPLVGGIIYQYKGYKFTMDLWMIILFVLAVIYSVFNCGLHPISKANE